MKSPRSWTDDDLLRAYQANDTLAGIIDVLGLNRAGSNYATIRRHLVRLGLSVLPLTESRDRPGIRRHFTPAEIFTLNGPIRSGIAKCVRRFSVLEYKCVICSNTGVHQGRALTLQIDHINGNSQDNRVENLRYLCPNCHAQTPTFSGKNRANKLNRAPSAPSPPRDYTNYQQVVDLYTELKVGTLVAKRLGMPATTVRSVIHRMGVPVSDTNGKPHTHKVKHPGPAQLLSDLRTMGWEELGRKYGVSGAAVKKWARKYGLPFSKESINHLRSGQVVY